MKRLAIAAVVMISALTETTRSRMFPDRLETLTNKFFSNLLDVDTEWTPTSDAARRDRRLRSQERPEEMDWLTRRSNVRLARGATRAGRGLCKRRRQGQVRVRRRGRVGRGHGLGPVRFQRDLTHRLTVRDEVRPGTHTKAVPDSILLLPARYLRMRCCSKTIANADPANCLIAVRIFRSGRITRELSAAECTEEALLAASFEEATE